MRNYICLSLIFLLLLISCGNRKKNSAQKIQSEQQQEYEEVLSIYSKFIDVSHFPKGKSLSDMGFGYTPLEDKTEKYNGFIPFTVYAIERFREDTVGFYDTRNNLTLDNLRFDGADTSIMFIPNYYVPSAIDEDHHTNKVINRNLTTAVSPPVPFINGEYAHSTLIPDSTYIIYIYDAQPKPVIPDRYHIAGAKGILPDEWIHGYSRGVMISDVNYEIIYWSTAW